MCAAATGRPALARALLEELMNVTKLHIGLVVLAIRSKEFVLEVCDSFVSQPST